MRLPRSIALTLACVICGPVVPGSFLYAQNQPAPAAGAAAPAEEALNPEVAQAARDFWHFASVANYAAAKARGEALLGLNAEPMQVMRAFEAVVADRNRMLPPERRIDMYERLLAWERRPELKEISTKILEVFRAAKGTQRANPAFIEQQIQRLAVNRLAYSRAIEALRESGELAVPIMIAYLRDGNRRELHVPIRSALRDLGIRALNPLVSATRAQNAEVLVPVIGALGDIGYGNAAPFLLRIAQDNSQSEAIRTAANQALNRLQISPDLNAAEAFVRLAEEFYYDRASIRAEQNQPVSFIWTWRGDNLSRAEVPSEVFNEDWAMRCCEYALELDPNRSDAVSLWLAAGYKREAQLPEGATDPLWGPDHLPTHVYAVTSGTRHLNPVLARAINRDTRESAVALKAIKSLQEIAGSSNLFAGQDGRSPVLDAINYPDRQVRFEAAFTVAGALPQQKFEGAERVVPVLAEAISQSGKAGIIIVSGNQDELNKWREGLEKTYAVAGAVGAQAAINAGAPLPGVDVIVIRENAPDINAVFAQQQENVRLGSAAILVLVASEAASPYAGIAAQNPMVTVSAATDEAGIAQAIENARKRAGALALNEETASSYALRAAELLRDLAISRGQVLDLSAAQPAVLAALNDERAELAKAAGEVAALLNTREAQAGLLAKATDEKTSDDLRLSFLKNLSTSAKFFGNLTGQGQVDAVVKLITGGSTPEIRAAAAEAHGALNLPPDAVKTLILQQSAITQK